MEIKPGEKRRRTGLSKEKVLRAALELAGQEGIGALSMRRLGEALGVGTMSLYNHVANKDEILDGILDEVLGTIYHPEAGEDWKSAIRQQAVSARKAFLNHPWAIGLMGRESITPEQLRYHDANLGCFRRGGFSVEMAVYANTVVEGFVIGFAVQEGSRPVIVPEEIKETAQKLLSGTNIKGFPYIVETLTHVISKHGFTYEQEFMFGLDLIIEALDRSGRG